jgi:hypothetical protein
MAGLIAIHRQAQAQSRGFESSAAFDKTMMQLFLKGRRYYESGSEQYGRVCLLQVIHPLLTSKRILTNLVPVASVSIFDLG